MKSLILMAVLLLGSLSQLPASAEEQHETDAHGHDHHNEKESHDNHHETKDNHKEATHAHDTEDHHDEDDQHADEHDHEEEQATHIDDTLAAQVGIETVQVDSQTLHQSIIAYGSLNTGPEQLSHVRARYTGLIKSVKPTLGDTVKKRALLAEVESNDSLKIYKVRAPISGTIIQRHANTGEVTQDQVLFSIANFDTLWAEFRIYPSQQQSVKAGQIAHIVVNDEKLSGSIQHIIPTLDKPYQLARVVFDNRSKGLAPGLLVEGHIVVGEFKAKLAVAKEAIQSIGGQKGVFVKQGNEYSFTPLQLGRRDNRYVEVIAGLSLHQEYVSKNSYLIKADIEKSEAEHEH